MTHGEGGNRGNGAEIRRFPYGGMVRRAEGFPVHREKAYLCILERNERNNHKETNETNMIKAIVFDMGGVIVRLDMDTCIANFKELAGFEDIEEYLDRFHQKGFISDLEEGKTQPEEFYRECLKHSRPGTTLETVHYCFCSLLDGLEEDSLELIRSLRGRYDLYVLSNNNPISRGYFRDMMKASGLDTAEVFRKEFYSYEQKMLKPSREIYQRVIGEVGTKPEEILFIDDARDNIEAAQALGIKTLWLKPGMDIAAETEKMLERG